MESDTDWRSFKMARFFAKRIFNLSALVITINLAVLALPIIGIAALRIFENVLHRQTEGKLIAEGAYVQSLYFSALDAVLDGDPLEKPLVRELPEPPKVLDDYWRPIFPRIDLSRDEILPPGKEGEDAGDAVHPAAREAGRFIQPLLKEVQRYNLSGVRVLDSGGVVVASTGSQINEDLSDRYEIKEALAGRYCSVLRRRDVKVDKSKLGLISRASRVRVFVAFPMIRKDTRLAGVVYLHRTSLTFFRDLWETRFAMALVLIISLTVFISLLLSFIVTRPLRSMINQAGRIAAGESGVSLQVRNPAPAEAHQLSEALSAMLETLKKRFEYVEEFTRNVSHEFKTPLTGIQGAIELLRDGWEDMSDEERARFIAIIDHEVRRMERLVKRLIELTRIELAAPEEEAATDLEEIINHLVKRYEEDGREVAFVKETGETGAGIAPDMAETMLANLIDNALTHGGGSPVTVILEQGPTVCVKDEGPGISETNLEKIFDRFFTTARKQGGTGLGLAMVKAIADAYEADVKVESDQNGSVFSVEFKPMENKEAKKQG
jgi:signal transduction histidine kinase